MVNPEPISAARVTQKFVLSKCDYFVDVQLWPLRQNLNPELWLKNFKANELSFAVHLLNAFIFYTDQMIDQLLTAAFQGLSPFVASTAQSADDIRNGWSSFVDAAVITAVEGEVPNITDSGFMFARKARQVLGIEETQILSVRGALERLINRGPSPVVFVDDFVGSGNQFVETWRREFEINGVRISFDQFSRANGGNFYYCPLVCSEVGLRRIERDCPSVVTNPAHVLPNRYNALVADSIIWPGSIRTAAADFVRNASARAGIPDTDGGVNDWRGFHKLGLCLAFAHSVPDATMPIFYWEQNGWNPLIRRR